MLINSLSYFRSHWAVWTVLGVTYRQAKWPQLYMAYSLGLNLLVTVGYPLHLGLSLFRNDNFTDDLLNVAIFTACLACSLKFIMYAYNFEKVLRMEQLLRQLDSRIKSSSEKAIYSQLKNQLRNILLVFIGIYLPLGISAELSFIFKPGRSLMYPAWFPFDWVNSTRNFYIANVYQFVGVTFVLLQNYVNDCFPSVTLCLISAHIKMLYVRFEQVGVDNKEDAENQLEACITDHKCLLELFQSIESFMSLPMLIQFAVTGLNVCISLSALLFFVTEPMSIAYFLLYGVGIMLETFPICYYGTDIELWLGKLQYAAFCTNWISQNRSFKKKLMLFVERSLKLSTPMAGGMLRIHVDTFFSTLKFAYSLFTIIIRMRK